jgi:uncharacterized protein (DUF4213/DUF364 family)
MVLHKIKEISLPMGRGVWVKDVRIGLRYTAVLLDNGQAGLAFTSRGDSKDGCCAFKGLTPLAGRPASSLLGLFDSGDEVESAVALATANALSNVMKDGLLEGDTLDHVQLYPGDTVGMVGYFTPMLPELQKRVSRVLIFERIDQPKGDLLPEREIHRHLPLCQVALITSSTISNGSIGPILGSARTCREVVLLGSSTPLIPDAFYATPVTVLSGVVITGPDELLRIVSEGGGTRRLRKCTKKVNLRIT